MRRIEKPVVWTLVMVFCLYFSTTANAHNLWLNVSDFSPKIYSPKQEAKTKVYFSWGHKYPVDDFFSQERWLAKFHLITPEGEKEELQPGPGGFLATEIVFTKQGSHIVAASLKPAFYTRYVDEQGKIHHKSVPKTGIKGVILSLYSAVGTKALIKVGEVKDDSFLKPVGHKLEIIPLKNPYGLKEGDFLPLQVLLEGKPARYCKVFATYSGFSTKDDFAYATYTDGKGTARIRILHYGPWLIKAETRLPAPEELKDKCNEVYYMATLTFEVP